MKKLLLILSFGFLSIHLFAQSFISTIGFTETAENKAKVLAYIEKDVKETYTAIGMGDPSTLRLMEEENLKAFKELIKVTNTTLLNNVIKTYCDIGMCNYSTILLMYNEQNKAANKKTEW